jgi:cytochrome c-type biogenesis protein CcmF
MNYIGEHLLPGQLGHFAAILSLVASLIAAISFYQSNRLTNTADKQSWLRLGRAAFIVETVSVVVIIACVYYILANHLFEYNYAWEHSDKTLQARYIFACLWEGQGSFLLWVFWNCVLGLVLIGTAKKWEAGVLTVISFVQFCLATMLIGIYFFKVKVGMDPFILVRTEGLLDNAPIFTDIATGKLRADYLTILKDGSGLNALLQNYWMVIHPPVLFLGFASTLIPFAFAYAGLVNNDHSWTKAALPWACFSGAALGTGVMMGAAWAYESLSFGGYWAWDPVENASLVPWLVMIAGLHTNLVYKATGYALKSTYIFYILSFVLILYSTFLTRSGVLGETSVHAFTEQDMNVQLYLLVSVFFWFVPFLASSSIKTKIQCVVIFLVTNLLALYQPFFTLVSCAAAFVYLLIVMHYKEIPSIKKEESTYSREFWMFIGSLVLFLASFIIIAKTSVPVYNKLFGTKIAPPEDVPFSYNQIQVFIAIILGILTAVTQYFKYKDTPAELFGKKVWLPTLIAVVISLAISLSGSMNYNQHGGGFMVAIHVALFAAIYGVVANTGYIWAGLKGKFKAAGASVAHVGFALMLVGIIISSAKKEVLSWNTTGISVFEKTKDQDPAENITLFKGIKTDMGKFDVTYLRDTANDEDRKKYFELKFDGKDGKDTFFLYPDIMKINKGRQEPSANPDKRHYWYKDIFAYATTWSEGAPNDTTTFRPMQLKEGDTVFYSNGMIALNKVEINAPALQSKVGPGETSMALDMTVISKEGSLYPAKPGIIINQAQGTIRNIPDTVMAQSLVLQFNKVADEKKRMLEIGVKENRNMNPLMTLKVYQFPFIILVWLGVIIMIAGFVMSILQRVNPLRPVKGGLKPKLP